MWKFETISVNMLRSHLPENLMDSFLNQVPENIDVSEYKSYLEIIQNEYSYTHLGRCISILEGGIVSKRDPLVIINQVSDITKEAIKSKSLGTTHTTRSLIEKVEYGFTGNDPIITLGLPSIDEIIGTCDLGNYVIIGGRPGMAKTATILQSAIQKSVYENQPTAIFTLEMSGESLMKRIISNVAGIALTSIRLRKLTDKQWELLQ
jgi:replicative DNA helicase